MNLYGQRSCSYLRNTKNEEEVGHSHGSSWLGNHSRAWHGREAVGRPLTIGPKNGRDADAVDCCAAADRHRDTIFDLMHAWSKHRFQRCCVFETTYMLR